MLPLYASDKQHSSRSYATILNKNLRINVNRFFAREVYESTSPIDSEGNGEGLERKFRSGRNRVSVGQFRTRHQVRYRSLTKVLFSNVTQFPKYLKTLSVFIVEVTDSVCERPTRSSPSNWARARRTAIYPEIRDDRDYRDTLQRKRHHARSRGITNGPGRRCDDSNVAFENFDDE